MIKLNQSLKCLKQCKLKNNSISKKKKRIYNKPALLIFRENKNPNEQYLLDYGTFLMTHHSLWQAGVTYLDYCSAGKGYLSVLLSKLEITSDLRVSKILHYATARRLHNVGE